MNRVLTIGFKEGGKFFDDGMGTGMNRAKYAGS